MLNCTHCSGQRKEVFNGNFAVISYFQYISNCVGRVKFKLTGDWALRIWTPPIPKYEGHRILELVTFMGGGGPSAT